MKSPAATHATTLFKLLNNRVHASCGVVWCLGPQAVAEGAERLPPAELAAAAEALVPYCAPGAALHGEYGSAALRGLVAAARLHVSDLR